MISIAESIGGTNGAPEPAYLDADVVAFALPLSVRDLMVAVRAAAVLLNTPLSKLEVLVGTRRAHVAALTGRPVEDLLVFGVDRG